MSLAEICRGDSCHAPLVCQKEKERKDPLALQQWLVKGKEMKVQSTSQPLRLFLTACLGLPLFPS
eukprot:scaffold241353_cov23-Tisochrysis_lutea.AAC.1